CLLTILLTAIAAKSISSSIDAAMAVAALCLLPASALAVLFVNWAVTLLIKPKILPKLELKDGIPEEYKTIIVMPTLLSRREDVRDLVAKLEVLYLANNDDVLDFSLLSDFTDSDTREKPGDSALLADVANAVAELNAKYPRSEGPRFHIFHRKRLWNPM